MGESSLVSLNALLYVIDWLCWHSTHSWATFLLNDDVYLTLERESHSKQTRECCEIRCYQLNNFNESSNCDDKDTSTRVQFLLKIKVNGNLFYQYPSSSARIMYKLLFRIITILSQLHCNSFLRWCILGIIVFRIDFSDYFEWFGENWMIYTTI